MLNTTICWQSKFAPPIHCEGFATAPKVNVFYLYINLRELNILNIFLINTVGIHIPKIVGIFEIIEAFSSIVIRYLINNTAFLTLCIINGWAFTYSK